MCDMFRVSSVIHGYYKVKVPKRWKIYTFYIRSERLRYMCNYHKQNNMGKIQNYFIENSDQCVNSLSKNLNHIVYMLNNRGAITEEQKSSIHESPSPYSRIKNLFKYIEINDELEVFINVLNKTENSGIAHFVRRK